MLARADVTDFEAEACEFDLQNRPPQLQLHAVHGGHLRDRGSPQDSGKTARSRCSLAGQAAAQKAAARRTRGGAITRRRRKHMPIATSAAGKTLMTAWIMLFGRPYGAGEFAHLDDCAPPAATLECFLLHTFGGYAA
jgi:hypothetical protein